MQLLQKWDDYGDSIYARLILKSDEKEISEKCPSFFVSKKEGKEYTFLWDFKKIGWYITEIRMKKKIIIRDNKEEEKDIVQIIVYNDTEKRSCVVESWLNWAIRSIISKLTLINMETDKVILNTYINKAWYAGGNLLDEDSENIAFNDAMHPNNIANSIKDTDKAKKLKEEYWEEAYKNYITSELNKRYIVIVNELSELPKYKRPTSDIAAVLTQASTESEESADAAFINSLGQDEDDLPF